MSMRDRLVRLAALKLLADEVKRVSDGDKAALVEEFGGRMSAAAAVVDGSEIGTVGIVEGRYPNGTVDGWEILDHAAFLKWTKKNRPSAVVETVRTSDIKSILGGISSGTGEVPDGVRPAKRGNDYVLVNQSATQRENAIRLFKAGKLALPEMNPQIEEASVDVAAYAREDGLKDYLKERDLEDDLADIAEER